MLANGTLKLKVEGLDWMQAKSEPRLQLEKPASVLKTQVLFTEAGTSHYPEDHCQGLLWSNGGVGFMSWMGVTGK